MEYTNCDINITINDQSFSIAYTFSPSTSFQDLLEYFVYLYPSLKLCQCYDFKVILNNFDYFDIPKNSTLAEYSNYLNNLQLYNNQTICVHDNHNFLLFNKIDIFTTLSKQFNALKNNKNKEINELNNKINLLNDIIKKNNELNEVLNIKTKEIEKLNLKIEELNQKIILLNNKVKDYKTLNENMFLNNKSENFYDVIVHIDSIKDINKGWRVEMSPNAEKNYKDYKKEPVLRIGVIGNANKGKSFILSKISKMKIPSGMSIKTEGLSIKYPDINDGFKNRKIALLDSAGLETPVLINNENDYKNKELFKEKSREKLITELFLQNYIVNNSDILIVVIDSLSFSEQKLLLKVKKEMERAKRKIPLYIIHNLKTFVSEDQVEEYIRDTLLKSATFTLEKSHNINTQNNKISDIHSYNEITQDRDQKIVHFIYANESSPAGEKYNGYVLNYIEKSYQEI